MKSIIALCSMLLVTISATPFDTDEHPDSLKLKCTEANIEDCNLFSNRIDHKVDQPLQIEDVNVYELEEEVSIDFDTKQYLPEGFNPFKGIGDLDWNTIELVELEEDVQFSFDTKKYLPKDFNSLKGLGDLDWNKIELYELEEDVNINFDTKKYLPANFDPYYGLKV